MDERNYPQRGDLVQVCEGGTMWEPIKYGFQGIRVIRGGVRPVLGVVEGWEEPGERPGVWVKAGGRKVIVGRSSWWPVEGPPVKSVVDGTDVRL